MPLLRRYSDRFEPRDFGSCYALDLDSMEQQTVTGTAPVTAWADRSGGPPFVVLSGGVGPAYSLTGLNSTLPAVTFNGTTHVLARNSFPFFAAGAATLYFVIRVPSAAVSRTLFCESSVSANPPLYNFRASTATASSMMGQFRNDANSAFMNNVVLGTSIFVSTVTILGIIDSGSSITIRLNGAAAAPTAYTRTGVSTFTQFCLGAQGSTTVTQFFPFECHRVVGFTKALSDSEASYMEGYLAHRVGQRTLLPTDHQWRAVRP